MRRKMLACLSLGAAAIGLQACGDDTPEQPVISSAPTCPGDPQPTSAIAPTPGAGDAGATVDIGPGACRDGGAETRLLQNE